MQYSDYCVNYYFNSISNFEFKSIFSRGNRYNRNSAFYMFISMHEHLATLKKTKKKLSPNGHFYFHYRFARDKR